MHDLRSAEEKATPIEQMLARIFREADARVRFNAFLRDMNLRVAATATH